MNYNLIPEAILHGIEEWVKNGHRPGSFLTAVLSNDLTEACARADEFSRIALFDIVGYLYNECPAPCWGSPEKVDAWEQRHADERRQKEKEPA